MLKLINITFITFCLLFYTAAIARQVYWNTLTPQEQCFIKREIDRKVLDHQMRKWNPEYAKKMDETSKEVKEDFEKFEQAFNQLFCDFFK